MLLRALSMKARTVKIASRLPPSWNFAMSPLAPESVSSANWVNAVISGSVSGSRCLLNSVNSSRRTCAISNSARARASPPILNPTWMSSIPVFRG